MPYPEYSDESYDEDFDDNEPEQDNNRLDGDYVYPSVERILQIAASMDHYDVTNSIGTREKLDIKDDMNIGEKYVLAADLCNQFAKLERTTQDPGMVMMMYEGMIFKGLWDLRLQTISKNRYKELAKFCMIGCAVMTGLAVYLLAR